MGIDQKILVRGIALCAGVASLVCATSLLSGCGQKGPLYMPNDPEFKQRATLPDIVRRQLPGNTPSPASGAASSPAAAPNKNTTAPASAASAATGR